MCVEKNTGIVLKTYFPGQCKVSLLDQTLGKIVGVPVRTDMSSGACISYFVQQTNSVYFMQNVEIIDVPMAMAYNDILFLHHILEVCYYFVPSGSRAPRLFALLVALYSNQQKLWNAQMKKLFLFQLFTVIGMYPEDAQFRTPYFHHLASASIDTLADQSLDLVIEQQLDAWLLRCIAQHPCAHNFKTVSFLYDNRIV